MFVPDVLPVLTLDQGSMKSYYNHTDRTAQRAQDNTIKNTPLLKERCLYEETRAAVSESRAAPKIVNLIDIFTTSNFFTYLKRE